MSGFIGSAIKALFEDGAAARAVVEAIGSCAAHKPAVLMEIRDVQFPSQRPVFRWEISFPTREEALRFDEAVRAACQHVSMEGE